MLTFRGLILSENCFAKPSLKSEVREEIIIIPIFMEQINTEDFKLKYVIFCTKKVVIASSLFKCYRRYFWPQVHCMYIGFCCSAVQIFNNDCLVLIFNFHM